MDLYADLLALKEPPMKILSLIGMQYNRLLMTKELADQGLSDSQIAQKAGMPPFAVKKQRRLHKNYSREKLLAAVGRDRPVRYEKTRGSAELGVRS